MKKICICMGPNCRANFSADTLRAAEGFLGQKADREAANQKASLLTSGCMGYCEEGPNVLIDGCIYHQMTAQKITETLQKMYPSLTQTQNPQSKKGYVLEDISDLLNF